MKAFIRGLSTYVSDQVLTNKDLETMVDTNDEWIKTRTGIEERRIFDLENKDLKTSDIATEVAQRLLEKTGIAPEYVDDSPFAPPVDTVTEPLPSPLLSLSDVLIDIAPVTPELESPVVIEMEPPFFSPTPF